MQITEQLTPVNFDAGRGGHAITGIVLHTMVGWLQPSIDAAHNPNRGMSMNYCVGLNGQIVRVVREEDTAWCNGNYASNQTAISIEHEDGGDYNGPRTAELYQASSELVADICRRHNIPCDRDHIKGHREVIDKTRYPGGTACPDNLEMARIIAGANAILNGASAPAAATPGVDGAVHVGTIVRPLRAVSFEGVTMQSFVTENDYPVTELRGDRAVLGNGLNTAFHVSDLQLVGHAGPVTHEATPAPVKPNHPYLIEDIAEKEVVSEVDRTQWNLDDTEWAQFATNSPGTLPAGTVIKVVAIAHHSLGSSYYMEDRDVPKGYNVSDLQDYTAPAAPEAEPVITPPVIEVPPAPEASADPQIIFEKLPAAVTYKTKLQPTNAWGFNHNSWPEIEADIDYQMNQGADFKAVGRATHELGGVYMMNAAAFGEADVTGKPNKYSGINVKDLDGVPDAPAPVVSVPVVENAPEAPAEPEAAPAEPTTLQPGSTIAPTPEVTTIEVTTTKAQSGLAQLTLKEIQRAKDSYRQTVKALISTEQVVVKDLEGFLPDLIIPARKLLPIAGELWIEGERFFRSIPSEAKGQWYLFPAHLAKAVAPEQRKKAEQILEDIWDRYHQELEDDLDILFHEGMKFENDIQAGFEDLAAKPAFKGYGKLTDIAARVLFHKNKNTKIQ